MVLEIIHMPISMKRFQRSIDDVVRKHKTLLPRLVFDESEAHLRQDILECASWNLIFTTVDNEKELNQILVDAATNVNLFDLSEERVFRCHSIRRSMSEG